MDVLGFISHWELVLILLLALLLFGTRLPKLARSVGRSLHEFKAGVREVKEETGYEEFRGVVDGVRGAADPRRLSTRLTEALLDPKQPAPDNRGNEFAPTDDPPTEDREA